MHDFHQQQYSLPCEDSAREQELQMGLADKSCSLEEMDALPPLEDSDFSEFYWTNDMRQSDTSYSQGKISYNDWDRLLFIFWKTLHYMNINKSRIGGSRNLWKMGALSIHIWVLVEKEGGPNLHLFLINMHMKFGGLLKGKNPLDHPLGQPMSWVRDPRA